MASGVETRYGAYLLLFVPYAVGVVLLARPGLVDPAARYAPGPDEALGDRGVRT